MQKLAIIGAGVAGLMAARLIAQQRPDVAITVFEKSRGLGGRAATRRHDRWRYDHGAQYLRMPDPWLQTTLASSDLVALQPSVWLVDGAGHCHPSSRPTQPAWVYQQGIAQIGRQLIAALTLDLRLQVRVAALHAEGAGWRLMAETAADLGWFDAVLLTPPAPQLRELLAASELSAAAKSALDAALAPATYAPCLALIVGYATDFTPPWYALLSEDQQLPVRWLGCEHLKPQRAPDHSSLLVLHFTPAWSKEHWQWSSERVYQAVQPWLAQVAGRDWPTPVLLDRQGWRYALPTGCADADALHSAAAGLFWAGDYLAGKGRVHLAAEQGRQTAERIIAWLAQQ